MRKIFSISNLMTLFSFCMILVAILFIIFGKTNSFPTQAERKIIKIWNVDSFEGGKGSRANFLNKVASTFEKKNKNIYIMVSSYTQEGVLDALKNGETPDLLSFSAGIDGVAEVSIPYNTYKFSGGCINGISYAYPWCCGQYYLFSLQNDFSLVENSNTVISNGGKNLCTAAAALNEYCGEYPMEDSTAAYVNFLNGKYKYMIGTQRDVCRFSVRNATYFSQPIECYSDLYQYIAITNSREETLCREFLNLLFSEEIQNNLSSIGMFSLKEIKAKSTISAFTSSQSLEELEKISQNALKNGDIKILKKYLKLLN